MCIIACYVCGGCLCAFCPLDSARIQTVQHPAEKHLPITTTKPFEEFSAVKQKGDITNLKKCYSEMYILVCVCARVCACVCVCVCTYYYK